METARLVLGAFPIVLAVLDSYKRSLRTVKEVWKYESTIVTYRYQVDIQKLQLEKTLQNIGLHSAEGELPTNRELREHLASLYTAGKCDTFMYIISEMERIMNMLLDKLDVDSQGKPKWTSESADRVSWEWRRVRRGLNHSKRDELIKQLQFSNTSLSKVFEKPEIPSGEDGLLVQKMQVRFNSNTCNDIRKNVRHTHAAMAQTWKCNCPDHEGNLSLSWHISKSASSAPLNIAVPSQSGSWLSLTAQVEHGPIAVAVVPTRKLNPTPPSSPNSQKGKQVLFRPQKKICVETTTSSVDPSSPNPAPNYFEISCLCEYINQVPQPERGLVQFLDLDDNTTKHLILHNSPVIPSKLPKRYRTLYDCLQPRGPGRQQAPHTPHMLSRKDRFGIAAAATWAMLYICGTPWLEDHWVGSSAIAIAASVHSIEPTISCSLKSQSRLDSWGPAASSSKIRNRALFALGVLLTELCLNTTLANLRQESEDSNFTISAGPSTTEVDDYELVNRQSDKVYMEAGLSYGYAVQRCLRCEFPGRDTMKSMEFEQFRKLFFDEVVAPVQAAYELQCD